MGDHNDSTIDPSADDPNNAHLAHHLLPPPRASYPDRDSLVQGVQAHAKTYGYNVSIKASSNKSEKKPSRVDKVWIKCDRGGEYRARGGLTEETRKRQRTSRMIGCPFRLVASNAAGVWTFEIEDGTHNHGPTTLKPRNPPNYRAKRGQINATPYSWPHDSSLSKFTTALVVIDMQRDFCEDSGYMTWQRYNVSAAKAIIPKLKHLLETFRQAEFPIYHTREGHRPDLSTLSSREKFRSERNAASLGIGSQGPLGRLLVRGEPGHDIIPALYPLPTEPIIDKPGHSAFAHTDFELLLRNRGIKNLILAGITTDVCVFSTMREANDRGFDCLLLEDGTAAADPSLHASTIESVRMEGGIFGATGKMEEVVKAVNVASRPRMDVSTRSSVSSPRPAMLQDGEIPLPALGEYPVAPATFTGEPVLSGFM